MSQPFQLICDASNYASGALLLQDNHPCAFASKKFLPAECNYTTEERELLVVIHALKLQGRSSLSPSRCGCQKLF